MTGPQHFFVSFSASILGATVLAVGVLLMRDWLDEHGLPSNLLALGVFVIGHLGIRWYFQHCVPIRCPHCRQKRCYAMPGRADRFRCEVCGADS